jgi:hypothetical protein
MLLVIIIGLASAPLVSHWRMAMWRALLEQDVAQKEAEMEAASK